MRDFYLSTFTGEWIDASLEATYQLQEKKGQNEITATLIRTAFLTTVCAILGVIYTD